MTILLDRRDDALLLYINGDLQFDSRDERIYHESLALPGLALAERRAPADLQALILGGGDGLIARELLKSPRLTRIDLIDYDSAMIDLARTELAELNGDSLHNLAVHVQIDDAWAYAERCGRTFALIVLDLTSPQTAEEARFHSVEWYQRLRGLLGQRGVLAVNGLSPSGCAEAYWSIYNAMRAAQLHPRPYRIALPSFDEQGYGDDWGFFLASPEPIAAAELAAAELATPRHALHGHEQLRRLFCFPQQAAALRGHAAPGLAGSGVLLHYMYNSTPVTQGGELWDALAAPEDDAPLPPPDDGASLLPPELRGALAQPIGARPDETQLLGRILTLMPALRADQTRPMIEAFLEDPGRFLAAIDLPALVDRLLRRAADLPHRMVAELRLLRAHLRDWVGSYGGLLQLGMRVVTIVTLVVVVANLIYPDAVYGKGGSGSGSGGSATAGHAYTGETTRLASPSNSYYQPSTPQVASGGGFRSPGYGTASAVDEVGSSFPVRRYHYYPIFYGRSGYYHYHSNHYSNSSRPAEQPAEEVSVYRLTPETDILQDGRVTVVVSDTAALLLDAEVMTLTDIQTGIPMAYFDREDALYWRAAQEITRQQAGLVQSATAKRSWMGWVGWVDFVPWNADDARELANMESMSQRLTNALASLGSIPPAVPALPQPPAEGAFELFSGAWLLADGSALLLQTPDGTRYYDGGAVWMDAARTQPADLAYSDDFKKLIRGLLTTETQQSTASYARLQADVTAAQQEQALLQKDKAEYDALKRTTPLGESVEYGTTNIPLSEAIRLTETDLASVGQQLTLSQRQLDELPKELAAARVLLERLK